MCDNFNLTDNRLFSPLKIIPALRRYAVEKGEAGNVPIVISTCFPLEEMCTHYAVRYCIEALCLFD